MSSNRRRPFTVDDDSLALSRPRRHRDGNGRERFVTEGPELKMRTERDGEGKPRININHGVLDVQFAPHLAAAGHEVPNLLDGPVGDSFGRLARRQFEVRHSTSFEPKEYSYVRAVECHRLWLSRQTS